MMSMGAKQFTELVAWQLANRMKTAIYAVTARRAVASDRRFCDQIQHASSSVSANIAEGFGRLSHREFARFVLIGRGSLIETQDHLLDGVARGHLSEEDFSRLWDLSRQALGAVTALLKYLQKTDTPVAQHSAERT